MAEAEEMSFPITYRPADMYRAAYELAFDSPKFWLVLVLLVALPDLVLFATQPLSFDDWEFAMWLAAMGFVITLYLPLSKAWLATKFPPIFSPVVVTLFDRGISTEFAGAVFELDWPLTIGAVETRGYVIILLALPGSTTLIPKDQLSSEQLDRLKEILGRRITKNVRLRP